MSNEVESVLLGVLAIAFTTWAGVVWHLMQRVLRKLDDLVTEIHSKQLIIEHRLTTVEHKTDATQAMVTYLDRKFRNGAQGAQT